MTTKKFDIEVSSELTVVLIEEAFTNEFCEEFNSTIFYAENLEAHAKHIGRLVAREVIDEVSGTCGRDQIVEGYGRIGNFVKIAVNSAFDLEVVNVK